MFDNKPEISAPTNAKWVNLTEELLQSPEGEMWPDLGDRFQPFDRKPAEAMTETFRDGIKRGCMHAETRAIHNDELLGFYSVTKVMAQISNHSGPFLGVAEALRLRKSEFGLMLSSIVRSEFTDRGFGQVLLEDAMALALTDKKIKAIFVEPANERVARMWRSDYHFEPVASSEIPDLLYIPIDVDPEKGANKTG